jgi:hypothetical protein
MCICNDRRWPETYRVMGLQGAEYTAPEDLRAGADVLLQVLLAKTNESVGSHRTTA